MEDIEKRRGKRITYNVNKAAKTSLRIGGK
jgi:hypothetical protein